MTDLAIQGLRAVVDCGAISGVRNDLRSARDLGWIKARYRQFRFGYRVYHILAIPRERALNILAGAK